MLIDDLLKINHRAQEMGGVYVIFIITQGMVNVTRPEDIKVG